jgi:hypothetical protein
MPHSRNRIRIRSITATGALALALAVPGAAGAQDLRSPDVVDAASPKPAVTQDLRSPDTREVATPKPVPVTQDLRSPDTREAATPKPVPVTQDLRSPDARDPFPAGTGSRSPVVIDAPVAQPATGFEWGDAAIGAAGALALILATGGIALTVRPHRTATR